MVMKKKKEACPQCDEHTDSGDLHPDHSNLLPRLNRAQGQLGGIEKMIRERRYCVDILVQFRAAMAALRSLEIEVFKSHLEHCVSQALSSRDAGEAQKKIDELTELLLRRTQL